MRGLDGGAETLDIVTLGVEHGYSYVAALGRACVLEWKWQVDEAPTVQGEKEILEIVLQDRGTRVSARR